LLYNLTTILDFDSLSGISTVLTGLTLKEHLFDSYILNATIVKMLISNNSFGLYGPDKEIIEDYNAVDGSKVYYLTRVGAENLVTAVTRGIGNLSLEIGNMNYNGITNMERDKLAYLLESGIIRIAISDILVEKIDSLGSASSTYIYNYLSTVKSISLRNEDVYDLTDSNGGLRKRKTFTKSDIIAVIEVLKQYM
jgi:hypothetical protein